MKYIYGIIITIVLASLTFGGGPNNAKTAAQEGLNRLCDVKNLERRGFPPNAKFKDLTLGEPLEFYWLTPTDVINLNNSISGLKKYCHFIRFPCCKRW